MTSSTLCCSPIESCHTYASGSTARPYLSATVSIRARTMSRSTLRNDHACLYPRAMFSSTVMFATSMYCWCTMPMPAEKASLGERKTASAPLMSMRPSSGWYSPIRMFIRVVFPAPFSPTSASISPSPTDSEMLSHAKMPGKRLVMPSIRRLDILSVPAFAIR